MCGFTEISVKSVSASCSYLQVINHFIQKSRRALLGIRKLKLYSRTKVSRCVVSLREILTIVWVLDTKDDERKHMQVFICVRKVHLFVLR